MTKPSRLIIATALNTTLAVALALVFAPARAHAVPIPFCVEDQICSAETGSCEDHYNERCCPNILPPHC